MSSAVPSPSIAPAWDSATKARWIVVMGVAGSGKSTVAAGIARAACRPLLEGDDFHAPSSIDKMRTGIPLADEDRQEWLDRIAQGLGAQAQGAVASCSALKRAHRDRLRAGVPGLRFVFLALGQPLAEQRVAARGAAHWFPPSLVASQFAALEDPAGEAGVLCLDAGQPAERLVADALAWLASPDLP
jgi:gluconokinase